jgi:Protein of unknown function (DUF642)
MMRWTTGLALAASLVGAVPVAQAASLIKDGGFEKPATPSNSFILYGLGQTFGKWTVVGASGNVATVGTSFTQNGYSFPAKSGNAWLDLTGTTNTATGVAQTIKTIAGTGYTVTFWIGNVNNPGGIFGTTSTVDVYDGATLLLAATNSKGAGTTTQVWQKFTTSFVATASKTTLSFVNGDVSSDTNCGLDAVSVVPAALAAR